MPGIVHVTRNDSDRGTSNVSSVAAKETGAPDEIEITPLMIDVGVNRLCELLEAGTGSVYVVSEVFRAMDLARSWVACGIRRWQRIQKTATRKKAIQFNRKFERFDHIVCQYS